MKKFTTILFSIILGLSAIAQEPAVTMTTSKAVGAEIYIGILTDNVGTAGWYDLGDGVQTSFTTGSGGLGIRQAIRGTQPIRIYATGIISIDCYNIQLSSLDVTRCTALKYLSCYQNQLAELNLSNNPNLIKLDCGINNIQTLDLANKAELTELDCSGNNLTALNVQQNTKLTKLRIIGNYISLLDVSKNNALTNLECSSNRLTYATMPIPHAQWQTYEYRGQKPIIIPKDINAGTEFDLSNQYSINGNITDYVWKKKSNANLLQPGTDYTISAGKTIFLKSQTDSVYCEMSNATFPNCYLANIQKTTNIKVSPAIKQTQAITFSTLPAKKANDAAFNLSASASSGLAVTFTSSDPSVASVTGNTVTIKKAGSVTITAAQAGDNSWEAAPSVTQTLTINKVAQTITFNAFSIKSANNAPFTILATASSGLVVTFTSSDPSIASVSGNTVTIKKTGTVTITADQVGDNTWTPAASVTQTLTIGKNAQTITFSTLPAKKVGDAAFELAATASSGLPVTYTSSNSSLASISGSTVTILKAGTVTITATQAGNDSWSQAAAEQSLTITTTTGIGEEKEDLFSLYPNPTSDMLYFKGNGPDNMKVSIYNLLGTSVWSGMVNDKKVNVAQLPAGVYILKTSNNKETQTIRFVKQ
jgi:uncharacterized protein YjdB